MNPIWLPPLAVLVLLFLVLVCRLHAFLALMLVSIGVGLAAGMSSDLVLAAMEKGMASTVGFIAVVVGLGSMFGALLEASGAAQVLAQTLVAAVGRARAPWALAGTGLMVGLSIFFDVGFILLVPLVYSLARETEQSVLRFALPLLASLAVTHAFLPPHPGPMAVAGILGADPGRLTLYGLAAGLPAIAIAGLVAAPYLSSRLPSIAPPELAPASAAGKRPSFLLVLVLVLIPVSLIVAKTIATRWAPGTTTTQVLAFLGHPFLALSIATLLAFYWLGLRQGLSARQVQQLADQSLRPGGQIILITGSGGIFKQVLTDSGAGPALAQLLLHTGLSPIWLAFLLALLMRVSLGSTTVSMMTAAGLIHPLMKSFPDLDPALLAVAVSSGAVACSHVNDSGFWLVKQYLGLSEAQTLQSWTVITSVIGLVGVLMASILSKI